MRESGKMARRKGALALLICVALVGSWLNLSEIVRATTEVFPEITAESAVDSGNIDSGNVDSGNVDSGAVETPATPSAPSKGAGHISVSVNDYIYGGALAVPQVSSNTGDVGTVVLKYKVTGADDSTYTTQMPTEVGNYTVLAMLPEDGTHYAATATASFQVRYLAAPSPSCVMEGAEGNNGWYKSEVVISPPEGYEMSVGNRAAFTTEGHTITEETRNFRFYLRKIATGEMTDAIVIANIRIDTKAPELQDLQDGKEYYSDIVKIDFTESNLKIVTVDDKIVDITSDEDGNYSFMIETGMRRMTHVVILQDEAGNETKVSLIVGPAWLKDGIVGEGNYYLEAGEEYHLPAGSDWSKSGDNTVYVGGSAFYANKEGEVTFYKE